MTMRNDDPPSHEDAVDDAPVVSPPAGSSPQLKAAFQQFIDDFSRHSRKNSELIDVLVQALKFTIRRRRPEGEWGTVYRFTDPHSFPSGHAARAFLIAAIASFLGPAWLALILWVWAPLVSLARVAMGVHYVSDVLAGAIVGVVVALVAVQVSEPLFMFIGNLIGIMLW